MIRIAHLLDDFGMGGVTRALTLFDEPEFARRAKSTVVPIDPEASLAPRLDADIIVDHMALSWKRLIFLASLKARNPRSRIVHIEHSYTRGFETECVPSLARFRAMLKLATGLVDTFVCVSQAQHDWLVNAVGAKPRKLRVIHPWCGRHELLDVPLQADRGAAPLNLLAYGRYCEAKNFAELVTAMRFIDPNTVRLTLVGDGPQRTLLRAMAADLPHVDVCEATRDPARHLSQCDAVIVPSVREAFGLVATEARLAGRAVILAEVDGLPEQVGSAGFSAPMRRAGDIARAIRRALKEDLPAMGAAGRREVAGQHAGIVAGWRELIADVKSPRGSNDGALTGPSEGALA